MVGVQALAPEVSCSWEMGLEWEEKGPSQGGGRPYLYPFPGLTNNSVGPIRGHLMIDSDSEDKGDRGDKAATSHLLVENLK